MTEGITRDVEGPARQYSFQVNHTNVYRNMDINYLIRICGDGL